MPRGLVSWTLVVLMFVGLVAANDRLFSLYAIVTVPICVGIILLTMIGVTVARSACCLRERQA